MTEWVDFFVYGAMIVTYWFVFATWISGFTISMVADRNPDWLAAHPEFARQLIGSRWFLWSCYAWGALSLVVLLAFQIGVWPRAISLAALQAPKWMVLKDINSTMLIVGLVYFFGCVGMFTRRLRREVPLAERRNATLERRSLDDFVPRWLRVATYTLAGIHLTAWLTVGVLRLYSTPGFWGQFVTLIVFSGVFFFFTRVSVNRPPIAMDRIFGPGYRRGEVRYAFAMEICAPAMFAVRLYQEVAGNAAFDIDRALHLGLVLLIVFGVLRFALHANPRRDLGERAPSLRALP
ncbi:MAG: hypothetical protein JWN86_1514 [Planctomycetota bacterium]|nr:hypothetical protein [Planctomycetota bacterium]